MVGAWWGGRGPAEAALKLGPNAGAYLGGFLPSYEIAGLSATWWTTYRAAVELPLTLQGGPLELSYRFARVLPETAVVDVFLGERLVDHFTCRGGRYETRTVRLAGVPATPARLAFQVDSHDRRNLGLRMDWVRFRVGPGGRLSARGPAPWLAGGLMAALFLALASAGLPPRRAILLLVLPSLAAAAWAARDPFAFAHVSLRLALPAAALAGLLVPVLRGKAAAPIVLAIVAGGYLVKGVGLFHPGSFYPDFGNARRYVEALRRTTGPLAQRTREAQVETRVAYPRVVAGQPHAFPYSPLPFLPLTWIGRADVVEDAFRHVGLLAASLEALLVYFLARALAAGAGRPTGGPGPPAGLAAAFLSTILPPLFSRLLLAMSVTLLGHLLDTALVLATLALLRRPHSLARLAWLALAALCTLLAYVSSLFTASAFLLMTALVERRQAGRLLGPLALALTLVVGWLYAPFARTFVLEILPALAASGGLASPSGAAQSGPLHAFARPLLFYGPALPALAAAGSLLLRRRLDPSARHVLLAFGLAFLLLLSLRAFGGGLFRDLKEITFVGPLLAVLAGAFLEELARRGRPGRLAAVLVAAGLAAHGLARYHGWLAEYASPFLILRE
jgi:hypothetical protein